MQRGPQSEQSDPMGHAPPHAELTPSSQMPSDVKVMPMPKRETKQESSHAM